MGSRLARTVSNRETIFEPLGEIAVHPSTGERVYWALVTSEEASKVLGGRNTHNRKTRGKGTIDGLIRDMEENRFVGKNGETIIFNNHGVLDDGQHRLTAIAQSGVAQEILVVENVALNAQDTVDKGSRRSVSDTLTLNGFEWTSAKAAIAKNVLIYQTLGYIASTGSNGYNPSDTEIAEYVIKHDSRLMDSCLLIKGKWKYTNFTGGVMSPAVVATVHYLCRAFDKEQTDMFFAQQVVQGLHLKDGEPALALRNYCAGNKSTLKLYEQYAFVVKSWNLFVKGQDVRVLKAPVGGWTRDNIPKLLLVE